MRISLSPSLVGRLIFFVSMLFFIGTSASAADRNPSVVKCAGGRSFQLQIEGHIATASFEGHSLTLPQSPSPIGTSYQNAEAALMIDGTYVAFVPAGDTGWRDCALQTDIAADGTS